MTIEQRITRHFLESVRTHERTLELQLSAVCAATRALAECLRAGGKVLSCGNGGSAGDAQHFAAELSGRFERERPGLAGIALTTDTSALTAIANDYGYERVFERQVQALGRAGDIIVAISTSGNSPSILRAVEAAQACAMLVLALTGRDGGKLARLLRPSDIELRSASDVTARIQELHILMLHCICDGVDALLYPIDSPT